MERFVRNIPLIGEAGQDKLLASKVLLVGAGGVGGYVLEMLARCGIGSFTVVDMDTVDESNLNRQVLALYSTVGRKKTDVAAERIKDINPSVKVEAVEKRYTKDIEDKIFAAEFDYCVDAIDSVKDKVDLILACKRRGVPCISALGAGNRLTAEFTAKDIFSVEGDALARAVRRLLRKEGVLTHKAVCSVFEPSIKTALTASISYAPAAMACIIVREVIKDLLCL